MAEKNIKKESKKITEGRILKNISMKGTSKKRVRIPLYPSYKEVRHLLTLLPGHPRKQVTRMNARINMLCGTRQNMLNWTKPDVWIPQRLFGSNKELALIIWEGSGKVVNPRHIYGHWLLSQKYALIIEDSERILRLTDFGRDFLDHEEGKTEMILDHQEGLIKLLAILGQKEFLRFKEILEPWEEYLSQYSSFGSPSTIRSTQRERLNNLISRKFVQRKKSLYSITSTGKSYFQLASSKEKE